ncbi:MAG: hypothetical protein ACTSRP_05085 [Candidatus Helarchaeota archaeon]
MDNSDENRLKVIINSEDKHKGEYLLKYYLILLNKASGQSNRYMNTNCKLEFENVVELPIKLAEIV